MIVAMQPSALSRLTFAVLFLISLPLRGQEESDGTKRRFDAENLQQMADKGNMDAQFEMGIRCLGGEGFPKDPGKGAEWLKKAADQQHTGAMNALGTLYDEGVGVAKDEKKAFEWYQKSAKYGFPLAQQNLAECYENGKGV